MLLSSSIQTIKNKNQMINRLLALFVAALIGIGPKASAQEDPVLFSVNDNDVHVSEFMYMYNKTNGQSDYTKENLQKYLDLYIAFKLQVQKGFEEGYHEKPEIKAELERHRLSESDSYLLEKEIAGKLVKEAYARSQKDVKVRHIFVAVDEHADAATVKAARTKINSIKAQTTAATFEETAKKASEDAYSKAQGGLLGWFTVLQIPYAVENAAYETPVGEVSEVVRSPYGFHIVKVDETRPAYGKVQVAHILVRYKDDKAKAKAQIDEAYKKLKSGEDFAALVQTYSEDMKSKNNSGNLDWFGINTYEGNFEEIAFSLEKDGAFSKPFEGDLGYHIIKRQRALKNPTYNEVKRELLNRIRNSNRYTMAQAEFVARVKKDINFTVNEGAIKNLVALLPANFASNLWRPAREGKQVEKFNRIALFNVGNKKVTGVDFLREAQRSRSERIARTGETSIQPAVERVLETLIRKEIFAYERQHLEAKYPEFKALMREYKEGITLFEVKKIMAWDKASENEEGLNAFYEAHKEQYKWPERARVTSYTIRSTDKSFLSKVRKKVKRKTPEEVKALFNEDEPIVQTTNAVYEPGELEEINDLKWKEGVMSEGYAEAGSFYFVKIEEVFPPSIKALDEARGYVIADYQDQLEKELIQSLRESYEVKVNDAVFQSLIKD